MNFDVLSISGRLYNTESFLNFFSEPTADSETGDGDHLYHERSQTGTQTGPLRFRQDDRRLLGLLPETAE